MAQKGRTDLTATIEQLILDNNNKEITASNVRTVLKDFRDSKFNRVDDELRLLKFNATQTLEQYLNSIIGAVPLWGSTQTLDVGSRNGNLQGNNEGIISSITYINLGSGDSEVTVNFLQSIANRKISISFYTDSSIDSNNDLCAPTIRRVSSTQIKVGLKEVRSNVQKIRLEILAFKTLTQ